MEGRRRKLPAGEATHKGGHRGSKRQKIDTIEENEDSNAVNDEESLNGSNANNEQLNEGEEGDGSYEENGEKEEEGDGEAENGSEVVREFGRERDTEAEAGIIERIKLENFMCHKHLELTLGPNINFIVGVNGSGKSAILVALTICLGAKATFTNRGKKLTEFIRGNSSYASIAVTLKNCGTEAYRYDDYGPSITIERRLMRSGASSYKVKSHKGKKTIATSRREVAMIMEQFNIQIDNPCVILMQDTSRQFLNTSRPQDKYAFFLKATQLEQMKEDYDQIVRKLEDMKITLSRKATVLPDMHKKVEELERLYNSLENLRSLQAKVAKYKQMLAWSYVVDAEKEVEEAGQTMEGYAADIGKCDAAIEKCKALLVELSAEYKQKVEEVNQFSDTLKKANEELSQAKAEINEVAGELNKQKGKIKDLQARLNLLRKREDNLRKYIEEQKQKAVMDTRKETEERMRKIEELQAKIEELTADADKVAKDREDKEKELAKLREDHHGIEAKEAELKRDTLRLQQHLKNLRLQKQDDARRFGPKIPELLQAIEREKRWKVKPIGPLGLVIQLKDPRWGTAIDTALGKSLNLFAVDNVNDMRLLKQLGRQLGTYEWNHPRSCLLGHQIHMFR